MNQIFNISGERYVTFDGIAKACAMAMGKPEPEIIHYDGMLLQKVYSLNNARALAKDFDFGKKKAFPMRDQHFFASVYKAEEQLGWKPKFGLVDGLKDSFEKVTLGSSKQDSPFTFLGLWERNVPQRGRLFDG